MSIRPIKFNANGSIDVWHDEGGHGGTVAATDIRFAEQPVAGGEDIRFIALPCPVPGCGAVSIHPAGGGADPEQVQRLFALQYLRNTSQPELAALRTWTAAKGKLKQMVEEMDGPGRYRLESVGEPT